MYQYTQTEKRMSDGKKSILLLCFAYEKMTMMNKMFIIVLYVYTHIYHSVCWNVYEDGAICTLRI